MPGLLPATGNNGKRKYRRMFGSLVPCRIVGEPTIAKVEGRLQQTVNIISLITTREGDRTYLKEDTIASRYLRGEKVGETLLDDRLTRVPELDGESGDIKPISQLVTEVEDAEDEYQLQTRGGTNTAGLNLMERLAQLQGR